MKITETLKTRKFDVRINEIELAIIHVALGRCKETNDVPGWSPLYNDIDLALFPLLDDDERG